MATLRQARVGEMIKRELAEIFLREMRDPRLAMVSVTSVDVARDFTLAKVFVSAIGGDGEKAEALRALQGASGYLRGQLGNRIELRTVPSLTFHHDTGIERGARMFELLKEEERNFVGEGKPAAQAVTEADFEREEDEESADEAAAERNALEENALAEAGEKERV